MKNYQKFIKIIFLIQKFDNFFNILDIDNDGLGDSCDPVEYLLKNLNLNLKKLILGYG